MKLPSDLAEEMECVARVAKNIPKDVCQLLDDGASCIQKLLKLLDNHDKSAFQREMDAIAQMPCGCMFPGASCPRCDGIEEVKRRMNNKKEAR